MISNKHSTHVTHMNDYEQIADVKRCLRLELRVLRLHITSTKRIASRIVQATNITHPLSPKMMTFNKTFLLADILK